MPEAEGQKGSAAAACPRCSSTDIAPINAPAPDEGGSLTADVTPPATDPPNMRCNACGHAWWVPRATRG